MRDLGATEGTVIRFVLISADPARSRTRDRRGVVGLGFTAGLRVLEREFPSVTIKTTSEALPITPAITVADWRASRWNPYEFDAAVVRLGPTAPARINIVGDPSEETAAAALEILTRYQSRIARKNAHSSTPVFGRVLQAHRSLHDTSKPLVLADYLHALDTWQWVLRLRPMASLEVQLAALFHDIERLISEADTRIEQHAGDYDAFKDQHAATGAAQAAAVLREVGVPHDSLRRVEELVARHERTASDAELALLNDADALSFFALNSPGFLDYYGVEHTRRKIAFTLRRLRREEWGRLKAIRLRQDFERLLVRELRAFVAGQRLIAEASATEDRRTIE